MGRKDWAGAAAAFRGACGEAEVGGLALQDQLRRNLALNFADLQAFRPKVLSVLEAMPADQRFGIEATASGRPTISCDGKRINPGENPLAALAGLLEQLKAARTAGQPMAILGTGDGYLLAALARHPVALFLGKEQCVHFLERNPGNLLTAMMIHDYSGESGPIRQTRFQWFVGAGCLGEFRAAQLEELALPWPELTITSPPSGVELAAGLQPVLEEILRAEKAREAAVAARAGSVTLERLLDATSAEPSRQPRALLLTTRFSTVLQYSTADLADGLRALGWSAEVVIEPTPHHTLTFPLMRDALLRQDPDVIFQLDHLRAEHGTLFPAEIPFVCWAQDNLPNLTNTRAGAAHGPMDFSMTGLGGWYVREYGYPKEAILPVNKLTKPPCLPASWESDGPALTYVSTASKLPNVAAAEYVRGYQADEAHGRVAHRAATKLLKLYDEGHSFSGTAPVARLVDDAALEMGIHPRELPHQLSVDLFEKVNNLCYRQQALGWVADVADEMGLELAIYGSGWDAHPRFARYFKGFVKYGADLERLTRSTKINLQIVPYLCLHQRLIDGLCAGGFFLVRSHPADTALLELSQFLEKHLPAGAETLSAARRLVMPAQREALEALAMRLDGISDLLDAIEQVRDAQAMGLFEESQTMPPRISEVSFGDKREFRERLLRFLPASGLRREIAREQREATIKVLSYEAGMRRVISMLHERLKAKAGAGVGLDRINTEAELCPC